MRPTPGCRLDKGKDRVVARVTMRGIHSREFQELAPIGERVEEKAIDMFRVCGGKIVEHQKNGEDPTGFLPRPGVPDLPRTPIVRNSESCIGTGLMGCHSGRSCSLQRTWCWWQP
jgi:SnoaL-like polyketide cyclase